MMFDDTCQRWLMGRDSRRPAGEPIRTAEYEVLESDSDADARAFVEQHHYSRSYPAARFRFHLYHRGALSGVAVFSQPMTAAVTANVFPFAPLAMVDLGRFVLLDEVPGNGESWFLARAFEQLRGRVRGVVSFSDPTPRETTAGDVIHPGHVGTIYQALNGRYLGRSKARTLRLLPDGTVFSERSMSKIRWRDRGWRYASGQLVAAGAAPLTEDEDAAAWLAKWIPVVTRPLRHPGNHKYAWVIERRDRRALPEAAAPYPKLHQVAA